MIAQVPEHLGPDPGGVPGALETPDGHRVVDWRDRVVELLDRSGEQPLLGLRLGLADD